MRNLFIRFIFALLISITVTSLNAQKKSPSKNITASDLESHVTFLASPLLKGRMNGEEGLKIAGLYIASQAKLIGLLPANGNSYFQPYNIIKKINHPQKTVVSVIINGKDTVNNHESFTNLIPTGPADFTLEGEVLFAGYGIKADKYNYNDFGNIQPEGRILLIMDRAPMKDDGNTCHFEEPGWVSDMNIQMKLTTLFLTKAKAILIVTDPKSGFNSFEESNPGIAGYLNSKNSLTGDEEEIPNPFMAALPKVIFINRDLADEILKGSGHTLEGLQNEIDNSLQSKSFSISNKKLLINAITTSEEVVLNNIAGYIEGRDPALKNEVVVFSAHYDHIGGSGNMINAGADDDASGCAALLSMAKAFRSMNKKPLRSVLFLWVSGEEIGLFGSESYTKNPLFPLEMTVANLNMDMIGRVKGIADSTDQTPMSGPNTVFVITGNQSSDLLSIAEKIDRKNPIDFDYSLSGRGHPLQLFARSDHYNFVKKDIPVLFFSTGLHSDYHTPGDVVEKLDFNKMEMVTRATFEIGLELANRKTRIVTDNPFSTWGK
jgi:hypothetical protein